MACILVHSKKMRAAMGGHMAGSFSTWPPCIRQTALKPSFGACGAAGRGVGCLGCGAREQGPAGLVELQSMGLG